MDPNKKGPQANASQNDGQQIQYNPETAEASIGRITTGDRQAESEKKVAILRSQRAAAGASLQAVNGGAA